MGSSASEGAEAAMASRMGAGAEAPLMTLRASGPARSPRLEAMEGPEGPA